LRNLKTALNCVALAALSTALLACSGGGTAKSSAPVPTPNPTQQARILTDTAEAKYLALMSTELGTLVRSQAWFAALTQAHVDLIAALLRTERAAKAKGEGASVQDMLNFAAEQAWYSDGLDDPEARALRGAFMSYEESLSNRNAPTVGPVLAQAIRHGTMRAVDLPEGGEMLLLVSADDPAVAQQVVDMAVEALPEIEKLVGAYPYEFLHLAVTDLGDIFAGLSYDQYIALSPDYVTRGVTIHELTHSTMYGKFPTWFEEGFAHFVEYYMTDELDVATQQYHKDLAYLGTDTRLYVGAYRDTSVAGYLAEREQGFLFFRALYDMRGIEGLTAIVRKLRTKSLTDQELLREFVQFGSTEEQRAMQAYFCENVVGTARNYCR
jgi:hypothetical protein